MKKGLTLLLPAVYMVLGGLISSTVVLWVQYQIRPSMDVPYNCILPLVYFWFGFALLFLLPLYFLCYWFYRPIRKGWVAFVVGGLWYPLQSINPINCDQGSSVLLTLASLFLTAVVDCLLVVILAWSVTMIGRFVRKSDSPPHRPPILP